MIIAFAGRKQSGKTTACEFVYNIFSGNNLGTCEIYNFADPLKQMCIDILGLKYEHCYGTDDNKNEIVNCVWPDKPYKHMTAREVMQYVGTDIFRKIQRNVWSDATIRKIQKDSRSLALIADCRFPNEVEAVKKAGGMVLKLKRNLYNSTHDSEKALDDDKYDHSNFDLVIDNTDMEIGEKNKIIYDFLINQKVIPL